MASDPSTWLAQIQAVSAVALCSHSCWLLAPLELPLLWGLSTGSHPLPTPRTNQADLFPHLPLSHNLLCSSNQGIICEGFFFPAFSQRSGFFLYVEIGQPNSVLFFSLDRSALHPDRYLLKFLLFQWFISSAGILSLYVYISLIVLVWNRKGRVVCLYSHFHLWNWQCHVW